MQAFPKTPLWQLAAHELLNDAMEDAPLPPFIFAVLTLLALLVQNYTTS
jgi:hypothetical protein